MAVNYLYFSAFSTAAGFVLLQWWTVSSLEGMKADGLIGGEAGGGPLESAGRALELLLSSHVTVILLVNFVINVYFLLVLLLKMLFFVQLNSSETRKVLERLIYYIIYKVTFLPLVVPPKISHLMLWSSWLIFLCSLKMFQSIARDRLEKLNASPSVTPLNYFRVYSALLLVLFADLIWMKLCTVLCNSFSSSLFLLLFFEPLSIAFDTLQAIMIHGFQLIEIYQRHSNEKVSLDSDIQKTAEYLKRAAGSLSEWKGILISHCGFTLDMMTLLMALGHYFMTWWLHGLSFHLIDVLLFLNLRTLMSAIAKRVRSYLKLRKALTTLDAALPDATYEELCAFDDECAICRGLTDVYSCPTCRSPLFVPVAQEGTMSASGNAIDGQQLVEHLNLGLNRPRVTGLALPLGTPPNLPRNAPNTVWRGAAYDPSLTPPRMNQGMDGASSSSSVTSGGFGRIEMMMRQLASVSENFAHDSAWNLWPSHTIVPAAIPSSSSVRLNRNAAGLRIRNIRSPGR